ncbi:magnesium chelatase subunit D [Sediminicoccus sp. KRV36]|uniref:magnesium chelatase subunit D n=1 Tax=Sediminicoccus sp. KRV36 TaxID=3133721 RepID=UPI00200C9554|nr:magnesium chelatase subunit D [Sediminicoccus rosea]UPY35321.1 magnesium chelatase subunit D [Sediminicoccus rosea]
MSEPSPGEDAAMAACLLAVDPVGLGGAVLRCRPGFERDRWLATLRALLPQDMPQRRLPPGIGDDALLGGLDLTATLAKGRPVQRPGLLEATAEGILVMPMAERLSRATAARLTLGQEAHRYAMVALDEGLEDEAPPPALADRLAFQPDLSEPPAVSLFNGGQVAAARARLAKVESDDALIEAILGTAMAAGIASLRAPALALRAARASAALHGRTAPDASDAQLAVRLVLGPRATMLPAPADQPPPEQPPETPPEPEAKTEQEPKTSDKLEDVVLAAERALLPAQLLASLAEAGLRARAPTAGREGAERISLKRGRPIGTRPGEPRNGARIALLETLRAAAPWQKLRPRAEHAVIAVRREDFRIKRFRENSESTAIFVVDASGSAALNRLAEAKGAVELLLAECYSRRDRVAVIAFRGKAAEMLLPPTQSLVRAKRALAGLPGGGASPLASGLDVALTMARLERRAGRTPLIVVLTDGRANMARDGRTGRPIAEEDALAVAKLLRAENHTTLIVDTAPRPQPFSTTLATAAGGRCLPLPQAGAQALAGAVRLGMMAA